MIEHVPGTIQYLANICVIIATLITQKTIPVRLLKYTHDRPCIIIIIFIVLFCHISRILNFNVNFG